MATKKSKAINRNGILENTIKCKDCLFHYDPNWSNLGADSKLPILCKCRHSKYMVFYNIIEKKCINYKLKK